MKIVFVCILKLIFISTASSQASVPCHVCEYNGVDNAPKVDLNFSVADVPKRCELVTYGYYFFDGVDMDDVNMFKHDEAAIKSLVEAKIPVYLYIAYNETDIWNSDIFEPKDQAAYDKIINPLIAKLKDLKPTGVILSIIDIYDDVDLPNKIKAFINKLKPQLPSLKFGLALYYNPDDLGQLLPKKEDFDFSITNEIIDLYFFDMNPNYNFSCTSKLACDGTSITSSDKNELTMELLSNAVSQSGVDMAKTIGVVNIFPKTPHQYEVYSSYSMYCDDLSRARAEKWCLDKSQKLYDMGAFIKKKKFGGVGVDWMEWDDIEVNCQCDKFPVTNLVFDGWDECPIKPCPKIG